MDLRQPPPQASPRSIAVSILLATGIVGAFAVLRTFYRYGFDWYGGIPHILEIALAGAFFGLFPAIAGIAAAAYRIRQRKHADSAAAIAAGTIWLFQYVIVLIVLWLPPSLDDLAYGIICALVTAALARVIQPKHVPTERRTRTRQRITA